MEDRLKQIENRLKDNELEFKMMNKTMSDISLTLIEMKDTHKSVIEIKQDIALMRRNMELLDSQVRKLFQYHDESALEIRQMQKAHTETMAKNDVKIGYGERLVWAVISAGIAAWSIFGGGK